MLRDTVAESKLLSYVCEHPNFLSRVPDDMVTDDRKDILSGIRQCYTIYGNVTPEGIAYFTDVSLTGLFVPVVEDITPIYDKLNELRKRRKFYDVGQELIERAKNGDTDTQFLADLLEDPLVEQEGGLEASAVTFLRKLTQKRDGDYDFCSTGFKRLDAILGGEWPRRAVSIVIGDPGVSKTSFVCSSMLKMAMDNHPSLLFSLEMPKPDLVMRWCASIAEIDSIDIQRGLINEEQTGAIENAIAALTALPMYVFDTTSTMSLDEIVPIIRHYAKNKGVRVVFIDYLQIIQVGDDRNKELGRVAKVLKNLAKELDIHICLVSQKNGKEGVWVVRDSGDVPAAVDIIMNLSCDDSMTDIRDVLFHFTKNRGGRVGQTNLIFRAPYLSFSDL